MIKKLLLYMLVSLSMATYLNANRVQAYSEDIRNNLNLEAVSSLFGESRNLRDFEEKLNDPYLQISNLDLNRDNQVDYLRVVESYEGRLHLIIIQAVLGRNTYQDVATIEVNRNRRNHETVQIIGDPYIYGPNYIIEPIYIHRPPIYTYFWAGFAGTVVYRGYRSPYHWGYYPPRFRYWRPRAVPYYRRHIHSHINPRYSYKRTKVRRNKRAQNLHRKIRRNDYARKHPNRSYKKRPRPNTKPRPAKRPRPNVKPRPRPRPDAKARPKPRPKTRPRPAKRPRPNVSQRPRPRPDAKTRPKPRPKARPRPAKRPRPNVSQRPRPRPDAKARPKTRPKTRPRPSQRPRTNVKQRPNTKPRQRTNTTQRSRPASNSQRRQRPTSNQQSSRQGGR